MPTTCARCGAQNPDGNQFCQACGTPLTQAAVAPPSAPPPPAPSWLAAPPPPPPPTAPPTASAAPAPLPVAYASPYYSPAGAMPQAPVHRTPWVLIISAVVVLILVMAGGATAIALLGGKAGSSAGTMPDQSTATPGTTLPTESNPVVTVPVPEGWKVTAKDNESIALSDPNGLGFVSVASALQNPKMTDQQQKGVVDASLKSKSPDAVEWRRVKAATGTVGGGKGIFWEMCFTIVANGQSLPAEASLFVGTNADGSAWYAVILVTHQTYMQNLITECEPILRGIQWKLT